MIASTGASYVILGHSERREYHAEKTALIAQKINKALEQNLKVIYCCGEVLIEKKKRMNNLLSLRIKFQKDSFILIKTR